MWTPAPITPPDTIKADLSTLSNALKSVILTWPKTVYEDDFYAPPAKGVLYVQNAGAVQEILANTGKAYDHGPILRRILGPVWRSGIAVTSGQVWQWQRRAAAPVFAPAQAATIVPIARNETLKLIDAADSSTFDAVADISDLVGNIVYESFLGQAGGPKARAAFAKEGARLTQQMGKMNLADLFGWPDWLRPWVGPTLGKPAKALHRIVEDALRSDAPETPLLMELKKSVDPETGQKMDLGKLRDNIVGALAAGRETTALVVAWALYLVAGDSDVQARLEAEQSAPERPLHRAVLMEAMRLFPPAPQIARAALHDVTLAGRDIPKGTSLVIPVYALHRRTDFWDNPHCFDPDRFMEGRFDQRAARGRYLPFGAGPRICLGMHFALLEAEEILATFLQAFKVHLTSDVAPTLRVGATLYPEDKLPIGLTPR